MRKNIKVYLSIILVIAVLYGASITVCYNNAKTRINNSFESESYRLLDEISAYWESDSVFSSPQSFICQDSYLSEFPCKLVIYDNDYNEIARTGPVITFLPKLYKMETEACFLADYLTDDLTRQIISNKDEGNWISSFSYIYEGDKVVPVSIEYKDTKAQVVDRVVFTDKSTDAETVTLMNSLDLDGIYITDYQQKYYDKLDEMIDSGEIFDKYNESALGNTEEGEYYWCTQVSFLQDDSESLDDFREYNVMIASVIDFDDFTIHDYEFHRNLKTLTAIFIAVCAVILAGAYALMKRYNLNCVRYAFTNAAAHELKTPLAIIENRCEFILEGVNADKTNEYVNSIYKESLRMNTLLANLLRYNKLASVSSVKKEKVDFTQIVNNEISKYSNSAQGRGITIISYVAENAQIDCNGELISLAVDNFLSNAVKFSPNDSTVTVSLEKHKKAYKLTVANDFNGELDSNIWEMLYTEDKSRSDKSTGMGLPICKEIFGLHRYKYGCNCDDGRVEFYFIAK